MHHPALGRALLVEDPQHVVVGVAVVDDQRLVEPLGDVDVAAEALLLRRPPLRRRCGRCRARSRRPRAPCRGPAPAARSPPERLVERRRLGQPRRLVGVQRDAGDERVVLGCGLRPPSARRAGRSRSARSGARRPRQPRRSRPRWRSSRRRRCRGGSGCRRPGAAAARGPVGARGRGGRPTSPRWPPGCGSALPGLSGGQRRRPLAWAGRRAWRPRRSPPCGSSPTGLQLGDGRRSEPGSVATAGAPLEPWTTIVTSPRTPSAAQATSSASGPRRTSSWVLVSSRQTAPGRSSPSASAIAASAASVRCGASKKTIVRSSVASAARRRPRSPALRGRKPSKQNRSTGRPLTASAVSTALGPGTAVTRTSCSTAAATSR